MAKKQNLEEHAHELSIEKKKAKKQQHLEQCPRELCTVTELRVRLPQCLTVAMKDWKLKGI